MFESDLANALLCVLGAALGFVVGVAIRWFVERGRRQRAYRSALLAMCRNAGLEVRPNEPELSIRLRYRNHIIAPIGKPIIDLNPRRRS